jgi:hypothetical protein
MFRSFKYSGDHKICCQANFTVVVYLYYLWFIFRYEWSAGIAVRDEPSGIFNPSNEIVWNDVGKATMAILPLESGQYQETNSVDVL